MSDLDRPIASGIRANPLALAVAGAPVVGSTLLLFADTISVHKVGIALAGLGVVLLLLFKQHVAKLSGESDYERTPWIDRTLVVLFVAALALVVAHTYPWATDVATEACACL